MEGCKTLGEIERRRYQRKDGKRNITRKILSCPDCGACYSSPGHECKLTRHHMFKLQEFAIQHGIRWKAELRKPGELDKGLQEAKDIIGRGGLYRIRADRYL